MSDSEDDDDIFGDGKSSTKIETKTNNDVTKVSKNDDVSDKDDEEDDDDEESAEEDDEEGDNDDKNEDKELSVKGSALFESQDLDRSDGGSEDGDGDSDLSETESDLEDRRTYPYIFSIDKIKNTPVHATGPDELLKRANRKAELYARKKRYNKAVREYIRSVALTRIVFGLEHWKVVEAHVHLAAAYLEQKGFTAQVFYHVDIAKEILTKRVDLKEFGEDRANIVRVLMCMQYTLGRAYSTIDTKLSEAEGVLKQSEVHYRELTTIESASSSAHKREWNLKLALAFGRLYFKWKRFSTAMTYFEKALAIAIKARGKNSTSLIPIYQSLGKVEQSKGKSSDSQKTIDYFLQAHTIAISKCGDRSIEAADTGYEVGLAYANLSDADAELSAETYLKEAMEGYKQCLGENDEKTLEAEDELTRLLIRTDNIQAGIDRLTKSIAKKEEKYGRYSTQVDDAYSLIGTSYQALDNAAGALKAYEECLQIESLIYGPQHKRTKETRTNIELISLKSKPPARGGRKDSISRASSANKISAR